MDDATWGVVLSAAGICILIGLVYWYGKRLERQGILPKSSRRPASAPRQSFPALPSLRPPNTMPLTQASSSASSVGAEPKSDASKPDMRQTTRDALVSIPRQLPAYTRQEHRVPMLFDGTAWEYLDAYRDGHWGVFGVTGGGKGNFVQHVILEVLGLGPALVEVIVLDGKGGLDYGFCRKLEHAACYANEELHTGCVVVDKLLRGRIALLGAYDARNIVEYKESTGQAIPYVLVFADEIADFPKADHAIIETIARMGRACGIVLFTITQYPTADVLSTQIQSNTPNRVVFRLSYSDQIPVALRRRKGDEGVYDPSVFGKEDAGVAVVRRDGGREILGRVPEITDDVRKEKIAVLVGKWPKVSNIIDGNEAVSHEVVSLHTEAKQGGTEPYQGDTARDTSIDTDPKNDALTDELIKTLDSAGWSQNKIAGLLTGSKQKRIERIKRALDKTAADHGTALAA